MLIEDYLYSKKLHEPLSGVKPEHMGKEEWDLLDRKAMSYVRLSLARDELCNARLFQPGVTR